MFLLFYNYWEDKNFLILSVMILFQYRAIGLISRVFTNGLGDRGSIPGRVIPKTKKMVLDIALLNTQHYKDKG